MKQVEIAHLCRVRERVNCLLSDGGLEFLRRRLGAAFVKKHGLRHLALDYVSRSQAVMEQCEGELTSALRSLENDFLPAAVEAIEGKGDRLHHVAVTVHQPVPVCLAGAANFWIDDHGKNESVRTILNVIPSPGTTIIVATCAARNSDYLNVYMHGMLDRMNGMLIMIETWMVRGTDHWFMTPSEWESIPAARRAAILEDIGDKSVSIGEPYALSVLDSARAKTLRTHDAQAQTLDVYRVETAKLDDRDLEQVRV